MVNLVYTMCALTSLACAALLIRGFLESRARLLLWSSLCFVALAVNNVLLVVDRVLLPTTVDLYILRLWTAVIAFALLVFGLIWDAEKR